MGAHESCFNNTTVFLFVIDYFERSLLKQIDETVEIIAQSVEKESFVCQQTIEKKNSLFECYANDFGGRRYGVVLGIPTQRPTLFETVQNELDQKEQNSPRLFFQSQY